MPIHFDFILDDEDAENLFDALNEQKCISLENRIGVKDTNISKALKDDANYWDELKGKLKHEAIK